MKNNENNYKEAEREEIKKQEESYALAKKKLARGHSLMVSTKNI